MTILQKILEVKKEEAAGLRRKYSKESFSSSPLFGKKRLSLKSAIQNSEKINLIAEIKKKSPSKGILKNDFNHLEIAKSYLCCGADAISVLTDENFFEGNISFMEEIAKIKTVPLLRKDFIIDEFQILEAKAAGADVVLLIAEALSKNQLNELTLAANENDLEVLLEIHSEKQLEKIDFSVNKIIGINNRNLATFEVNIKTTELLAKKIPPGCLIVAESGINSKNDINFLKELKINAVLVGEHFMKSKKIEETLKEFIDWCKYEN